MNLLKDTSRKMTDFTEKQKQIFYEIPELYVPEPIKLNWENLKNDY